MSDLLALSSTALAGATVATAAAVLAWNQWTSYRKSARRRVGALVAQANWDPDTVGHKVVVEFVEAKFKDLERQEQLKINLERLALLGVMDEKVIHKTVREIEVIYRAAQIEAAVRTRLLEFSLEWLQTRHGSLPMPGQVDPLRGEYEYDKKRKVLFHALHKAFA